jgi:putative tryptophan/tyrosine transport system substrate-binding protein
VAVDRERASERVPIGVLMGYPETESEGQAFVTAFRDGLQQLGWFLDGKLRIDTRWSPPGNTDTLHRFANELVASQPDLILSQSTPTTAALLQATRSIPILFAFVSDPASGRERHRLHRYGARYSRQVVGAA